MTIIDLIAVFLVCLYVCVMVAMFLLWDIVTRLIERGERIKWSKFLNP